MKLQKYFYATAGLRDEHYIVYPDSNMRDEHYIVYPDSNMRTICHPN